MRCPDCNKFVPFDTDTDPEVDSLDVEVFAGFAPDNTPSSEVRLTGSVRLVNCCGECGTELTETTFDIDEDITEHFEEFIANNRAKYVPAEGFEVEVDEVGWDRTEESVGKGRGRKQFYGFDGAITVKLSRGGESHTVSVPVQDDIQSSHMDEC